MWRARRGCCMSSATATGRRCTSIGGDLGLHRLKDLSAPERIYQLQIDGLPDEFPLLKTIEAGMKNLPVPRTSFVGRAEELEAIDRLLEDPGCRLLTLVGPGGAGKTKPPPRGPP